MKRGSVLFIATSHERMGVLRSRKTGIWLEDFALPCEILSEAGFHVAAASPLGGDIPVDPDSLRRPMDSGFDAEKHLARSKELLNASIPLDMIREEDYDAVFYPGGYGSYWDLSVSRENAGLLEAFIRNGKPVAAVRQGSAAFLAAKTPSGLSILNGRRVTGASDDEERMLALDRVVPFSLGKRLSNCGADYSCAAPWEPHVIRDGMLVTGQNPQSSGELARAMVSMLDGMPRES